MHELKPADWQPLPDVCRLACGAEKQREFDLFGERVQKTLPAGHSDALGDAHGAERWWRPWRRRQLLSRTPISRKD